MAIANDPVSFMLHPTDGTSYPEGLHGKKISLWARLFAVISTLDAMTSDRPYCKGLAFEEGQAEMQGKYN